MTDPSGWTVGRVADDVGVTVRTLHHWDAIGLARASLRSDAGYRVYSDEDRVRVRRVVLYRELGLGLDRIGALLDGDPSRAREVLTAERALLAERIERLRRLGDDLDRILDVEAGGSALSTVEQAEAFGEGWRPEWTGQAHRLYGGSTQWLQYAENASGRSAEQWRTVVAATAAVDRELAEAAARGVRPGSAEASAVVERHRAAFSAHFPLTRSMQVCLARRYEDDPAFTAHYEALGPGLASWLRRAVDASAREHGIDPDTAVWE